MSASTPPSRDKRVVALRRFAMSITALTVVGQLFLGFEQAWAAPVAGVLTAYTCELAFESVEAWARGRRPRYAGGVAALINFLLPAHIAGLACALLLYGNSRLLPTMFAAAVAIATKYVVRVRINGRPRHILNPSNAGIALTFLVFPSVGMFAPYMFTENFGGVLDVVVPAAILTAGTMLNAKLTGKMPLILAWVGGFIAQAVLRGLLQSDMAVFGEVLAVTGTAFILFTNYMITDPGTTPTSRRGQVCFGLSTAAVYALLIDLHIVYAIFWSLTLVCLARLVWYTARNHLPLGGRPPPAPVEAERPAPAVVQAS
jgi:Na+-translocating ferredoxin:NAD+ oxidoreductase RnfD subunit